MSEDEYPEPYYDPARREAMRQKKVAEGVILDLPLASLSDDERTQIDNHLMMEDYAKREGVTLDQLLDTFEAEAATAKRFDSVEAVMAWLNGNEAAQHDSSSSSDHVIAPVNVPTYPTGKYAKKIAGFKAELAMRTIFGVADLPYDGENLFDVLERKAREASEAKTTAQK